MDLNNLEVEKNLKIVYMGTPDFSATVLKGLVENYKVRAVVSQPDRMVGRNKEVRLTPVKQVANDNTILVIQPEKIKEAVDEVLAFEPDLIITCAYGQIIPKAILDYPRLGCINVHASLLPKLRGGAPIHRCILEGHSKTGITIMYMSEKMDAGDMIMQREIEIENEDTAETLHDKLSILGRDLLLEVLPSIINGTNERTKQDESQVTYGFNISREDEKLDFNKTSRQIYNHIRGLNSWPGAYTKLDGKILKIWSSRVSDNVPQGFNGTITAIYKDGFGVKTANGEIVVTEVQMEGKKRMSGADFANGYKDLVGKMLS
jgi:methionyl-tRNA formyltransferase